MQVLRRRSRQGIIVATITINTDPTPDEPRVGIQFSSSNAIIVNPTRKQLTKKQWFEYGELIRSIKRCAPDFQGFENCSLQDLRDVYESTKRCDILRVVAAAHA